MLTVIRNGVSHRFDSGKIRVPTPGDVVVVIRANDYTTPNEWIVATGAPGRRRPRIG